MAAAVSVCATGGCDQTAARDRDTFRVALVRAPAALDPALVTDNESMQVVSQIFETLVGRSGVADGSSDGLARRWSASDDGKVWTFHLRPKVRFHDGTPVDAEAVTFSFERQRDPSHPYARPEFAYWSTTFSNILKVEAVGKLTVRIHVKQAQALLLPSLAMFPVGIVSPAAVKARGEGFAQHPVGSGPYRFVSWSKNRRRVVLERNPVYRRSITGPKRLVFEAIRSAPRRMTALTSGRVDMAFGLSGEDRQLVRLHPGLRLHNLPGNSVAYLALNTSKPPFDDLRVRRAVNHAVDRHALVKLVYQGTAQVAHTPVPPGVSGYNRQVKVYRHNPGLARELLAEAGYVSDEPLKLYVMTTSRPYLPQPLLAARIVQANLADVGIRTELVRNPLQTHLRATSNGEHHLCLAGWTGDNRDADNFLYALLDRDNARKGTGRNQAMFDDDRLHRMLLRARNELDVRVRRRLYRQAQVIVADQAPWVPLAHGTQVLATSSRVGRPATSASAAVQFFGLTINRGGRGR